MPSVGICVVGGLEARPRRRRRPGGGPSRSSACRAPGGRGRRPPPRPSRCSILPACAPGCGGSASARGEVGEFGGDGLAEDQRAGLLQRRHARSLGAAEDLRRQAAARAGLEPVDVEDVLDADQHAEQRRPFSRIGPAGLELRQFAAQALEPPLLGKESPDLGLALGERAFQGSKGLTLPAGASPRRASPRRRCAGSRCSGRDCRRSPGGSRPRSDRDSRRRNGDQGHQEPGGAEAALQAVALPEGLLQGWSSSAAAQRLDGGDRVAVRLDGEQDAGADRLAVEQDGAGAAHPVLAADVGAGQRQLVAQEVARAAGAARPRARSAGR